MVQLPILDQNAENRGETHHSTPSASDQIPCSVVHKKKIRGHHRSPQNRIALEEITLQLENELRLRGQEKTVVVLKSVHKQLPVASRGRLV